MLKTTSYTALNGNKYAFSFCLFHLPWFCVKLHIKTYSKHC